MPNLYVLVGVPASGKSTWLDEFAEELNILSVISSDNIIQYIAEEFNMSYDEAFPHLIAFANEIFHKDLDRYRSSNLNVVIDRTNLSPKVRRSILKEFPDHRKIAVVFPTPEDSEWQKRLNSREGKTIPQHVLDSMAKNYSQPTIAEGFDEVVLAESF